MFVRCRAATRVRMQVGEVLERCRLRRLGRDTYWSYPRCSIASATIEAMTRTFTRVSSGEEPTGSQGGQER